KLKMDLMYIERYSFRMDMQIILMTLKTMFFPGSAGSESASVQLHGEENRNEDKHE
ncbi:MAG TPA: exopolysaccharide biosynthesis polyprenyl glycosylphosphotransferase, partial [Ruminococcus sp.]|nr:exopolysaccharide biosynthesis polyprenyl glycosylphosphotransferase [Ruminococcus sp.]